MEPADHFFMWAFLIVIVASEAIYINSNLCFKTVEEDYTETVPYGKNISELFKNFNLSVPPRKVHKTKIINKNDCCDGFERKDEESPCVRSEDPNSELKKVKVPINFNNHPKKIIDTFQKYNITLPKFTRTVYRTVIRRVCRPGYEKENEKDFCKPKISDKEKDQEKSCNCGPNSKCIAPYTCQCDEGFYSKNGVCVREPVQTDEEIENEFDNVLSKSCDSDGNVLEKTDEEIENEFDIFISNLSDSDVNEHINWDDNAHKNEDENEHKNEDWHEHKNDNENMDGNEYKNEGEGDDKHVQRYCSKKNPETSYEYSVICCPGYEKKAGKCTPICSTKCGPNSYCHEPNTCQCMKGYKKGPSGLCLSDSNDFRIDDPHVKSGSLRPTPYTPISIPKNDEIKNLPGGVQRTKVTFRNGA